MTLETADLRLLRIFMTIAEAGGFAAAQSELNLSLATISSHMSALETRLGVTLCRRGRAGFALTNEGSAIYEEARRLFGALERFDGRARGLRERLTGTLSLGMVDNIITDPNCPLDRAIARFTKAAPDMNLSLVSRPPNDLLRDVTGRQIQVAIGSFPRVALGLTYVDLYQETHRFYCGGSHSLFAIPDGEIDLEVVRQHRIVARGYWGARDLKVLALGTARAVVTDMESEAQLILSGAYLGYLPDHYAAGFVAAGRMREIRPDLFAYHSQFQAAMTPDTASVPAVELFVRGLLAEIRAQ